MNQLVCDTSCFMQDPPDISELEVWLWPLPPLDHDHITNAFVFQDMMFHPQYMSAAA